MDAEQIVTITLGVVGLGLLVEAQDHRVKGSKSTELHLGRRVKLCMTILASGVLVVLGIVLVVLLFTWPLGMALIAYAGKLPGKQLKEMHQRSEDALNEQKLQDTTEPNTEEEAMPWDV